jgi:TDG/mug DNA glycosylase family protein
VSVGTAAGESSAQRGHYYAGRGNQFWALLLATGLVGNRALRPEEDERVLSYGVGLTDLARAVAASTDAKLRACQFEVPAFLEKTEQYLLRAIAFNGRTAARIVATHLGKAVPTLGSAPFRVAVSRAFVLPLSSGSDNDPARLVPMA